jgi:SAM-dependent methyltransferase
VINKTDRKNFGKIQVNKNHYLTEEYLGIERFNSLQSQFRLCMQGAPGDTFLEVGPGPGLLVGLLKHFGREITTVDFAEDVKPDYVATLPNLPFDNGSFDVVCAFEVLEHIPWDLVPLCVDEMRRISRKKILISLPNQSNLFEKEISLNITVGNKHFGTTLWKKRLTKITNPEEHFWEIGYGDISLDKTVELFKNLGFRVNTFFVEPWFQFFILNK